MSYIYSLSLYLFQILSFLFQLHFYKMKLFIIILSIVIFLIMSINVFVSMVIFIAEDYHVIDHVKIYELFEAERYQTIRRKIMKHNFTILVGDDETGVKNFIEHQANIHTVQGRPVVIKRYQSASHQKLKILKTIKETRFYMEMAFGIDREERTQVFFVKNKEQLPLAQINFIREKYPNDNIIIISQKPIPIKIKGFKKIVFPPVTLKEMRHFMQDYYDIKPAKAEKIIMQNDESVEKIFKYFKRRSVFEREGFEQLIQVDDIEDLNQISHQLAEKQRKKVSSKAKKSAKKQKR